MSHPPFMIIPQNATPYYPTGATPLLPAIRTPLLLQTPVPPTSNANGSTAPPPPVIGKPNSQPAFKAPAHKHAHHLHSIPPREKSTRTLIIDHLLWVHSRTRFSQARAELGMTDRTGGSSSPNYLHRERPENFDEEDEAPSDGECLSVLKHRSGWSTDDEDARLAVKDSQLAKALRTRSESVEKVVASMLHQPPEVRPLHPDDNADRPDSPEPKKTTPIGTNSHPHTLPNGVRVRAALATLINDFFARESPLPSTQALNTYLPLGIVPLLPISSLISEIPSSITHANHFARQHRHPPATPSAQTLSLYAAGVDPSASPSPRCPRHLYTACTICVPPPGSRQASRRPVITSFPAGHPNAVTGWQDGSGIGSGLSSGPKKDDTLLRRKYHGTTNLADLISRFLKLSALVAMELGLEADEQGSVGAPEWNSSDTQNQVSSPPKGKGPAMGASNFDPRSPTPTQQQNSHSPSGPESVNGDGEKIHMQLYALRPSTEWYGLCAGLLTRAVLEGYVCGGWRGLGALEALMKVGLGLRPDVLNVPTEDTPSPLMEGNGENSARQYHHHHQYHHNHHHHHDDQYEEFDPDDFPTITESAKVLFPSLRHRATTMNSMGLMEQQVAKEAPEQEFEYDMEERLSRFYDIQPTCPDLLTHLEDVSWQYPAEPLERAMLRFFEAISKWRGKPELETYKKKSPRNLEIDPSIAPLTMDALVHSSPIVGLGSPGKKRPRGPRIEKYFLPPPQNGGTVVNGMGAKRRRESVGAALDSATKRMRTQFDAFAAMGTSSMGNTSIGSTPMGSTPGGP